MSNNASSRGSRAQYHVLTCDDTMNRTKKHEERQAPDAEPRVEDGGDPDTPCEVNKTKHVVSLIVPIRKRK